MDILKEFILNFLELANAMSLYILIGLLIAGLLKELLPEDFISRHLGKSGFGSVLKATLLGIPMPVCSCSVIPLAKSLQKEGASNGAVNSFLISTPITGVDSLFATYSFFGVFFTVYRLISSIIIAIIAGVVQNIFYKDTKKSTTLSPLNKPLVQNISIANSKNFNFSQSKKFTTEPQKRKKSFSIKRVFSYAFNTLFSDIAKSLLFGLFLGAIFSTFLPKDLIGQLSQNVLLTYILILLISTPLYICATSSLPIGASLLSLGVPVGAIFVFLSAGPATNTITVAVVKEMFGKFGLVIYLSTIMILSLVFGYILDMLSLDFELLKYSQQNQSAGVVEYLATILMFGMMIYYGRRR